MKTDSVKTDSVRPEATLLTRPLYRGPYIEAFLERPFCRRPFWKGPYVAERLNRNLNIFSNPFFIFKVCPRGLWNRQCCVVARESEPNWENKKVCSMYVTEAEGREHKLELAQAKLGFIPIVDC